MLTDAENPHRAGKLYFTKGIFLTKLWLFVDFLRLSTL